MNQESTHRKFAREMCKQDSNMKFPESLSRSEMDINDALLGPTNYRKAVDRKPHKADNCQKGENSCHNS